MQSVSSGTPLYDTLNKADIVTLTIGSNDILGPFLQIVADELGCSVDQIQIKLADIIVNSPSALLSVIINLNTKFQNNPTLDAAVAAFSVNFPLIIKEVQIIAPNAELYVTNVYNPYKGILIGSLSLDTITQAYIGLLNNVFSKESNDYKLVDVNTAFNSSQANLINADAITNNFDPHPNTLGHALIAEKVYESVFVNSQIYKEVTGVTINPTSLNFKKGGVQTFTATVSGTNSCSQSVTWNVSGNSSSSTQISDDGTLVVATDETATTLSIKATSIDDITKYAIVTVSIETPVITPTPSVIPVPSVSPEPTNNVIYSITYKLNGGTNNKLNVTTYSVQSGTIQLKNPSKKGYEFIGWFKESNDTIKITEVLPTSAGNITLYAKWKKISVKQVKVSSVKNLKKKELTIRYQKVNGVDGYQITFSLNKKFKNNRKVLTTGVKKDIAKLSLGKTYYIKVRAYKINSVGKKVFGKYSTTKKITLKK